METLTLRDDVNLLYPVFTRVANPSGGSLRRRRVQWLFLILSAALAAYFLFWPVPIEPVAWTPRADPGQAGPFSTNSLLSRIDVVAEVGFGPEAVAVSSDGRVYTGLQDGRIMRMRPDGESKVDDVARQPLPEGR